MASHDIVAQRDYLPKLQDIPVEVDEDEETIKMVQLVKSQDPLVSLHSTFYQVIRYNGVTVHTVQRIIN